MRTFFASLIFLLTSGLMMFFFPLRTYGTDFAGFRTTNRTINAHYTAKQRCTKKHSKPPKVRNHKKSHKLHQPPLPSLKQQLPKNKPRFFPAFPPRYPIRQV